MDIKREIAALNEELISLRRDFHQHPELGFEEFRTGKIVADYLEELGLEVQRNIAKTGLEFESQTKGFMHACGHDGHLAMMLIAAKVLSGKKDQIKGNIKFIFQPNEEDAGAEIMIGEGILENPKVDAAIGIHLWSPIESGKVGVLTGPLMASSYYFKLTVNGKGGHGGAPHTAISPILAGLDMIKALQGMAPNEIDALNPTIVTFGKINAGTSPIIIPEKVEIEGSIRCLHPNTKAVQERMREIVEGISKVTRTTYSLEFKCGNELVNNDEEMTALVREVAEKNLGKENILSSDIAVMLGEDFSAFCERVPSTFIFVGVADEEKGTDYPHHHPKFNIDEDALSTGVELHVRTALEYLSR